MDHFEDWALGWTVNEVDVFKHNHQQYFGVESRLHQVHSIWSSRRVRRLVHELLDLFYQATDLDVHWAYWLKEGDTSRGMTAYWKDTIFIQPGGCRHPFDVVSTVIHEIGHQMRQRSKHCCEDHHCIVWQKCSQQAGALLNRKISCTPHSQLTPIMRELAFHYGDNWLANVHIGIYSCANVCCRDAPVDILPCLVKQIELDWETEVSK